MSLTGPPLIPGPPQGPDTTYAVQNNFGEWYYETHAGWMAIITSHTKEEMFAEYGMHNLDVIDFLATNYPGDPNAWTTLDQQSKDLYGFTDDWDEFRETYDALHPELMRVNLPPGSDAASRWSEIFGR